MTCLHYTVHAYMFDIVHVYIHVSGNNTLFSDNASLVNVKSTYISLCEQRQLYYLKACMGTVCKVSNDII